MKLTNLKRRGMALVMLLALTAGLFVSAWAAESKAAAPELSMWDPTSVTVKAEEGQEYAIAPKGADPDWTKAAEPEDGFVTFEDLTPAAAYVIYTRMKGETADPQTKELTLDLISIGVFSEKDYIPGAEIIGQIEPEDTQGLTYQWYYDSITENEEGAEVHDMTAIDGATAGTYTVKEADLGKYLAFKAFRDGVEVGCQDSIGPVSEEGIPALPGQDDVCPKDDSCPIGRFTDAQADAWYHDGVHWALGNNVMNGVGNDRFDPNGTATRAMVVTMVWRLEGEPSADKAASFADVSADAWYANAVAWASEVHAVNGTSDTTFSPDTPITREQLAAILYRYAQAKGEGFQGAWFFLLDAPDADKISEYADEAMHWMVMNGVITGRDGGMLAPQDNATRAEIATIFQRFCGTLGEAGLKPITPKPEAQQPADQQPAEPEQGEPAEAIVDYGDSKLYTKEEMDAAIAVIRAEFDTWKGCELHSIRFAGDGANSADIIKWMNELKEGQKKEGPAYTQCIEFVSDFHSPKDEADLKDTAWEGDQEYKDWQWWLARTDGGDWELLTWGY